MKSRTSELESGWGRAGERLLSIGAALAFLCLSMTSIEAAGQGLENEEGPLPTLEITPGTAKPFRAAILRFRQVGAPVGEERITLLRQEIETALAFSSLVLPLDHAAYLTSEESTPLDLKLGFDCDSWKQSGAEAIVQGELRREGERLRVDLRVWDTARCKELKTGSLRGDRDRLDRLGRLIADETVEALTGKRGVSSTEIAFVSDRTGTRQIFLMSSDGRDQRRATHGSRIKSFPDWVPDGRAILYMSYDDLQPGLFLTSRSKEVKPGPLLTRILPGAPKYRGRFAPGGEELAIVASVDGDAEIFRVSRQGKKATRLTNNPAIDIAPSWSPDGKRVVFVSDRTGSPQLYLMDRNGGNLRRLSFTGSYNTSPSWSPDGRWIAYETRVRGQFDLWLIDPSGEINFPITQHPSSDEAPSWSPDGRKIAFSSRRRGRYEIYVMDWNGENLRRLTQRAGQNIQPAWGPRMQ